MEKELEQISTVPGVGGSFLCDNRGEVIVSSDPAVLATVTMNTIGREVGRAFVALETAGQKAPRLEFAYNTWRLLARDIGDAVLFVVCQPDADMAMVRMSADVAIGSWQKDAAARKRLQRHRAERSALVDKTALDHGSWNSWAIIQSRGS
ncbi:MAG: hypothetical protein AMXMBFR80_21370 [Dehalococcoidia bacterium]